VVYERASRNEESPFLNIAGGVVAEVGGAIQLEEAKGSAVARDNDRDSFNEQGGRRRKKQVHRNPFRDINST
jgi:hypothetical protein